MRFFALAFALVPFALQSADFVIAPHGSDTNPGTLEKPFATLARARDAVRALDRPDRDVTVAIRGGEYRLGETVVFGLGDSAAPGRTIAYVAYPGEKPVFLGSVPVTGWRRLKTVPEHLPHVARNKVWVADVSEILARKAARKELPHGLGEPPDERDRNRFHSLYVGARHLPRARGAGFRSTDRTPRRHDENRNLRFPKGMVRSWPDWREMELRIIPCSFWIMNILAFESIDEESLTARMRHGGTYALGRNSMEDRPSCFIENTLAVLDEPGEWVLHADEGRLYYWPEKSAPEEGISASVLTEFVRIEGRIDDAGEDTPVHGIVLDGLTFSQGDRLSWHGNTGWGLQHDWEMFDRPSALVRLRGAENCEVRNCDFVNAAHTAIRLDLHAQRNRIVGNHIRDVGGVGILLAGYGPGTKDVNRKNEISNNYIHHTGWTYWGSPSLFLWQSGENHVAHNHLHHTPYTAIVVSGRISWARNGSGECSRTCRFTEIESVLGQNFKRPNWKLREQFLHARNNVVEYNEMHNGMELLGDGNAVYVSGCGGGNVIRRNWCHDNLGDYMNAVIRNDDDQHGSIFDGNILARSGGHGEGFINKGANTIVNNIVTDLRPTRRHRGHLVLVRNNQTGAVHQRNVYYARRPGVTAVSETKPGKRSPKGAFLNQIASDRNLYFSEAESGWGQAVLEQFHPQGVERNSRAADPRFMDGDNDDYRFREGSPALAMGIPQPMNVRECGLEAEYRARWIKGVVVRTFITPDHGVLAKGTRVKIASSLSGSEIRYTTGGTKATRQSKLYAAPFALEDSFEIHARSFADAGIDLVGARAKFTPPPKPVRDDFEGTPVGQPAMDAHTTEQAPFTARITDETAASGTHSLKFLDGTPQKHPFNPHVFYRVRFEEGRFVGRFALRVSEKSDFYVQWRTYGGGKFFRGPSIRVVPGGKLVHDERELGSIPIGEWVKFELTTSLGKASDGTFSMSVALPDGTVHRYDGLEHESGFKRMDWLGFVSVAESACATWLDDVELRPVQK
ncbi:MAG: right-handed parallel beta-helix repeat-containing protein [Lentisphaeria bacterium]|nr:right-handed parallel beta-helix repeat-containing protein [Lentisphaeria bacterium]